MAKRSRSELNTLAVRFVILSAMVGHRDFPGLFRLKGGGSGSFPDSFFRLFFFFEFLASNEEKFLFCRQNRFKRTSLVGNFFKVAVRCNKFETSSDKGTKN